VGTGALNYQAYQGARLAQALTPTVCGGGGFLFLGLQKEKGHVEGFGSSHGAGGGVITNPLEGMFFVPLAKGSLYGVPVEGGALATTTPSVGAYGEAGKGNISGGVGGYANISSVLTCDGN
jgi:hypothetical protein